MSRQITAKNMFDALRWIHTQPHHMAGGEGFDSEGQPSVMIYGNYYEKLRVRRDAPWYDEFTTLIRANPRPHDDRMFALTVAGKRFLTQAAKRQGIKIDRREHP